MFPDVSVASISWRSVHSLLRPPPARCVGLCQVAGEGRGEGPGWLQLLGPMVPL